MKRQFSNLPSYQQYKDERQEGDIISQNILNQTVAQNIYCKQPESH